MSDLLIVWGFSAFGVLVVGKMLLRGLRTGEFLVGEDGPPTLVRRADSPIGYWATVVFW